MPSTSTPVAIGSRVPAWPTLRVPASRRTRATTSWEVIPAGLSTTASPESVILDWVDLGRVGQEVVLFPVLEHPRLLVGVLAAGVRRAPRGGRRLVLGSRLGQHLVEVAGGLRERVGHELQRRDVPHAELLAPLGTDQPLARLQRRGGRRERRLAALLTGRTGQH